MARFYRMTTCMLAGALLGMAASSFTFVQGPTRFGQGAVEQYWWNAVGLVGGTMAGLGVEFVIRLIQRPNMRFSIRELMIAFLLLAIGLVVLGAMVESAKKASVSDAGQRYRFAQPERRPPPRPRKKSTNRQLVELYRNSHR